MAPISAPRRRGLAASTCQGLRGGVEQDGVDGGLVLEGDGCERLRNGEDDVEVGHGQQLALTGGEPACPRRSLALRAMAIAAGVVGDPRTPAALAGLDM